MNRNLNRSYRRDWRDRRALRLSLFTAVAAFLCFSSVAEAGGYNLLPRGARSLGRGGAFVAGVDDLSAAWVNPARLASLRGVHVLGDVGLGFWHLDFQRADDPTVAPEGFARSENISPPVWSPSLFLGWDFGLDWFQVTIGFFGPYAGDLGFDSMASTRYTLVYLDMFQAIYQLAVAFRPLPWLAIGGAFQVQDVRMTNAVKLSGYTGFDPLGPSESTTNDILTEIDVASHFNPSALFGLWAGPADWVDIGLSLQLPIDVEADGTVTAWLPSDNAMLRNAWVDGEQVTVRLSTAMVIRGGVAFRLPARFEIEVDVWAELWEPHENIFTQVHDVTLRDVEGDLDIAFGDITLPQDWETSYGVAFGIEWETLVDRLSLRLGFTYDSSAIPDQTVSVAWFDSHKIGLFVGLTVEVWRFAFDIGYGHLFFVPRTIDNSVVSQINPLEPQAENLRSVVGNGRYESSLDILALTIRAQFDTPRWGRGARTSRERQESQESQVSPPSAESTPGLEEEQTEAVTPSEETVEEHQEEPAGETPGAESSNANVDFDFGE